MMVSGDTFARYSAMAPPEQMECVPTSPLLKPRISGPIILTMFLISFRIEVEDISNGVPLLLIIRLSFESLDEPG